MEGIIRKATGGFYYVPVQGRDIECRARGILRKDGVKPCVGDRAVVSLNEDGGGNIDELLERKNILTRPPLCNLDNMVVVLSVTDPPPNLFTVDKLLAVLEHQGIEPLIAVTKSDLDDPAPLEAIYSGAGFSVFLTDPMSGAGVPALAERLSGRFSAFSGNSGVGKSSLLNAIDPRLGIPTGGTSKKLGRGRHTTRHVEAFELPGGGWVADTPGFTSLELALASGITARDLPGCFREFERCLGGCKFLDCTHTVEKGCAVLTALEAGGIAPSRHRSYAQLYGELREVRDWERR